MCRMDGRLEWMGGWNGWEAGTSFHIPETGGRALIESQVRGNRKLQASNILTTSPCEIYENPAISLFSFVQQEI